MASSIFSNAEALKLYYTLGISQTFTQLVLHPCQISINLPNPLPPLLETMRFIRLITPHLVVLPSHPELLGLGLLVSVLYQWN